VDPALSGVVTAAWGTIALLVVGLPLLAWWLGGRRSWSRVEALHQDAMQQHRDWGTRHRLSAADAAAVERAVLWGRALDDPRLRAAAVERVRSDMAARRAWPERHPRWTAFTRWLAGLWGLLLLLAVANAVISGEWPSVLPIYAAGAVVSVVLALWRRRTMRRALELNSPPGE
jgi:hypothetical protein